MASRWLAAPSRQLAVASHQLASCLLAAHCAFSANEGNLYFHEHSGKLNVHLNKCCDTPHALQLDANMHIKSIFFRKYIYFIIRTQMRR